MGKVLREGPLQWGMAWEAWLTFQCERRAQYPGVNFEHEIPGGTAVRTVENAVAALIERHEVLRTTFGADEDGLPVQRVWSPEPVVVHELDRVLDPDAVEAFKTRDFAVDTEWPCRFALVSRGEGKTTLLACFSHIALDHQAREILMRDFSEILDAALSNRAPDLPAVACQPVDYARYERSEKTRALRERSRKYWQDTLERIPVATFDVGRVPDSTRYVTGRFESTPDALGLGRIADRIGVPMSAVFSAVFSVALGAATAKAVVPLAMASHGRVTGNALHVVAALTRDVVVPIALRSEQSFDELAKEIHRLAFEAVRYSMVDTLEFSEWKALAGSTRGGEVGSRITLNFIYTTGEGRGEDDAPSAAAAEWDFTASDAVEYSGHSHHLHVGARVSEQEMELLVFGSEAIVGRDRIESLARSITDLLALLDKATECNLGDLRHAVSGSFPQDPESDRRTVPRGDAVDPEAMNAVLMRHPGVTASKTGLDQDGDLVSEVEVANALSEEDLIAFLKSQRPYREVLRTIPDRMRIAKSEGREAAASPGHPESEARCALVDCARSANGLSFMDAGLSYVEAGGAFLRIPVVLRLLRDRGYDGIEWRDLQRSCSLSVLATRLRSA